MMGYCIYAYDVISTKSVKIAAYQLQENGVIAIAASVRTGLVSEYIAILPFATFITASTISPVYQSYKWWKLQGHT